MCVCRPQELLSTLLGKHRYVGDVRGLGLFLGVELVEDRATKTPNEKLASFVAQRAKELGVQVRLTVRSNGQACRQARGLGDSFWWTRTLRVYGEIRICDRRYGFHADGVLGLGIPAWVLIVASCI